MIIDGKQVSQECMLKVKEKVDYIKSSSSRVPKLVVVLVGDNKASQTYVKNKERGCANTGIDSKIIRMEEDTTQQQLLEVIDSLNKDNGVDGILIQLPLPKQINEDLVLDAIDPTKDVDGFHPQNVANLFLSKQSLVPCTPKGMITLLDSINYSLEGKHVVVVGRSNIVGKPIALLCLQRNATVTMAHSKTENLQEVCKLADVLIVAVGRSKMITKDYIKPGAIVLDVGINRDQNNKLCGDVDFEDVKDIVGRITPVPGGVGPMTIVTLLENTVEAYLARRDYGL